MRARTNPNPIPNHNNPHSNHTNPNPDPNPNPKLSLPIGGLDFWPGRQYTYCCLRRYRNSIGPTRASARSGQKIGQSLMTITPPIRMHLWQNTQTSESDVDVDRRHCAAIFNRRRVHGHDVLRRKRRQLPTGSRIGGIGDVIVGHLEGAGQLEFGVDGRPRLLVAVWVVGRLGGREAKAARFHGDVETGATQSSTWEQRRQSNDGQVEPRTLRLIPRLQRTHAT